MTTDDINPPVAKIIPTIHNTHGDNRIDAYAWLRNLDTDPDVRQYLEAENEYARAAMAHTLPLQKQLFQEMKNRLKESDCSVPDEINGYHYYYRTEEGLEYRIYCRRQSHMDANEEVLLNLNELVQGLEYLSLGFYKISPDHRYLAYSLDTDGSEIYTLYIKDLETQSLLPEQVSNTYESAAWANDSRNLFYTVLDLSTKRPCKLYRHTLGTPVENDPLLYHETDDAYFMFLEKTRSQRYLLLTLESITRSEVHIGDADRPETSFWLFQERQPNIQYSVSHHGNWFYISTNDNAPNFRIMRTPVTNTQRNSWEEVIPHRPHIKVDGLDTFKNHLTVYEHEAGLPRIHIRNLETHEFFQISFPEPTYTVWAAENPNFDTPIFRFHYTSLDTPRSVYDYNMDTHERVLKKQVEVLGYDASQYIEERIFTASHDGVHVPISLVHKKDIPLNGNNPLYLYSYGAYGINSEPEFSSTVVSLLERGFIYAIAHIRGGEKLGREWYEQGKLLHKKNTFYDFIACAEHLIQQKYTRPDKLVIHGGSAGGLLMGAVTNMRPDLFQVVIAEVPFVDVLTTMLDPSLPLTVNEYDEWGNPNDKIYYDYIKSYSPYDNVEAKAYPNILIQGGLNDPRVAYWEPAKWTAKLRALKTDNHLVLLETKMSAGHGGASGRYEDLRHIAFRYAFILDCLSMVG